MIKYALMLLMLPMIIVGQQLVFEFKLDTVQYEEYWRDSILYNAVIIAVQAPGKMGIQAEGFGGKDFISTSYSCRFYRKKSSDQLDIFSYSGKVGSVAISPTIIPADCYINYLVLSQTIIDNDIGWEYIVNFRDSLGYSVCKVIDDNGSVMLADTGFAYYCYDGHNTYVGIGTSSSSKFWQFRSNINPTTQPLAKSIAALSDPIIALTPQGDLRVTLEPSTGGKTRVQLFDALGRQLYSKNIALSTSKTSFSIPTHEMANNQFIARVNNGKRNYFQKKIPVR